MGFGAAIRFGQTTFLNIAIEAADFLDYAITDAESYATVLRGADVEISQLEPGPLRGHHLRVGLPGGDISWVETNLPLRGCGRFPAGVWTLSVVARTGSRSQQHGVEVRAGSLFYHRPGAEHDGLYGRDFSVVCLCMRDEVLMATVRNEFPEASDLLGQPWRVCEPAEDGRRELVAQFEQAATILRTEENVRRSFAAKAVMQDELLAAFLEALAEVTTPSPMPAVTHAAALVRQAEEVAGELVSKADRQPASVSDLCVGCGVPRRTLNHAFQQVLGMGPVTYLRRLRLNEVRRSLRQPRANDEPKSVTEIALDHGFWHLGRFSSQYRELFGHSPRESPR
jgi:AraC family ethanolamine operon transcriptional activator